MVALKLEQSLQALQSRLSDVKANVVDLQQFVRSVEVSVRYKEEQQRCCHGERVQRLAKLLASPAAQLRAPETPEEVPMRLSLPEVAKLFLDRVPGVQRFVVQGRRGHFSLKTLQAAYAQGLPAAGERRERLLRLLRLVVHRCHDGGAQGNEPLRELAEAFREGDAAQARAIERAAVQVGEPADFRGRLLQLAGERKAAALRALAVESCAEQGLHGEGDAERYEQRLLRDLGDALGLNEADVQMAALDEEALARFAPLSTQERLQTTARFQELFDVEALISVVVSEVRNSDSGSPPTSLASALFRWAAERTRRAGAFHELEARLRSAMDAALALCILEVLLLGRPGIPVQEASSEEWARALLCPGAAGAAGSALGGPPPQRS